MSTFFTELRRRKVYRVAVAYGVVGWFLIQISATVFPAWELPGWSLRLVIVLVLAGFPIALIFAWVFDVTPGGIEATPAAPPQSAARPHRRRNITLLALAGVIVSIAAGFLVLPQLAARKLDRSIAVLPFENFSDDKENAYFADGIQDDVLTALAKCSELKVISRTSVMPYRGQKHNVRQIGKALGVTAVLEGSVRRSGNRVRVNVQLINATNDQHIWAEDYEGDLTDVFAIQRDLAGKIASTLQAKLSPNEHARMDEKPTQNSEAYLLYLKARELEGRPDRLRADLEKAEELYQRAVELDPGFAQAYVKLSHLHSWRYHSDDPVPPRAEKARAAAFEALRLQPDLPESHLALGYCYYWIDGDYEKALKEFAIAQRGLPNDSETYLAVGAIERRQGKWAQSTANMEKAASLNPKNAWTLEQLAFNYIATKNFETADKTFDRALEAAPQSFHIRALKAKLAIDWKGDFAPSIKLSADFSPGADPDGLVTLVQIDVLYLQRKYAEALQLLDQAPRDTFEGGSSAPHTKALWQGILYFFLPAEAKARAAFEKARLEAEEFIRQSPQDSSRHARLGLIVAGLGNKEAAIAAGKRAVELLPESKDALDGPGMTITLAQIYALTGENDEALRLIERSLSTSNGITTPVLKLDPIWDRLRADPRFQALLSKYGGGA